MDTDEPSPGLPATTDPFALLGVASDADERTIKRAYARLIKVYRPERSPDEFARVHAAFEQARWNLSYRARLGQHDLRDLEPPEAAEPIRSPPAIDRVQK